ncbi:hypothetical protein RN001_008333 [Aquatica leii]|uniref:THAP-type domain-containing protein n=1 Tax=Aquatica leii TaxID=1421715 RepID=A0AAN7SGK9_9COLE|nr:hypothetical protein RN001_008333 [Aquatica leii]
MVLYRPCAILGCKDKTSTRHRFPNPKKDKNRYDEWIRICGNAKWVTLNPATVYLSQRVCHIHFQKSDYASNMYIKRTSLPTLHIPNNTMISLQLLITTEMSLQQKGLSCSFHKGERNEFTNNPQQITLHFFSDNVKH